MDIACSLDPVEVTDDKSIDLYVRLPSNFDWLTSNFLEINVDPAEEYYAYFYIICTYGNVVQEFKSKLIKVEVACPRNIEMSNNNGLVVTQEYIYDPDPDSEPGTFKFNSFSTDVN